MRRRRKKHVRKVAAPNVSLTSLIDIALTLLIIFMVSLPVVQKSSYAYHVIVPEEISLPSGDNGQSPEKEKKVLAVTVDADGVYLFENKRYSKDAVADLLSALKKSIPQNGEKCVITLLADKEVSYGPVAQLVDTVSGAQIAPLAIMMKQ